MILSSLLRDKVATTAHSNRGRKQGRQAMAAKLSRVSRTLTPSPIQELSHLAQRCGAINLAEGFPDFPAPPHVKEAAVSAINADLNQYRHVQGICDLLAVTMRRNYGLAINPLTDVVICCGQSEAFAAAIFATINQGDEVLLFDPAYETYESCIALAGGIPVYVPLDPPYWTLNVGKLMKSFTSRTKAVVLNSPHNPTGKVFSKEELQTIAGACCKMDCFAITDEVYEYITFDMQRHISIATLPSMQERTIITSSLSKTFSITAEHLESLEHCMQDLLHLAQLACSEEVKYLLGLFCLHMRLSYYHSDYEKFTGWRIGWACAPASIASAIRNIHIRITDSAPAPFQEAAVTALQSPPAYFKSLKADYEARRDFVVQMLSSLGFQIRFKPQGSVFVFAELPENWLLSDIEFVKELIEKAGVAAVPGCGFFHADPKVQEYYNRYVRFAFCKSDATLNAAAQKMGELVNSSGYLDL